MKTLWVEWETQNNSSSTLTLDWREGGLSKRACIVMRHVARYSTNDNNTIVSIGRGDMGLTSRAISGIVSIVLPRNFDSCSKNIFRHKVLRNVFTVLLSFQGVKAYIFDNRLQHFRIHQFVENWALVKHTYIDQKYISLCTNKRVFCVCVS